nr:MAG TPA: putative terminase small subunit [Caudoviricetes sp.]DAG39374.1 MAG TPA: putative terminase small subunit [Caudoviricetes sp.]DAP69627.1 MAG TPA: putative terminase small subunit [Caudoviricetes sp.]DAR04950.1 MAG TPA: putative terminase small subunit [Caudoviricetes sp.]
MARTGRPPKEINQKLFENLCGIQCTETEICGVLECSEDTLNRWCKRTYGATFEDTYKSKSQVGKSSLRRSQWKLAEKSATMAIWLGKQYLGQKDIVEAKVDADVVQVVVDV